jgi:autotransporter-associated beta strand protein
VLNTNSLSAGSLVLNLAGGSSTFSGSISGIGVTNLVKSGSGTVTLSGVNTHTGFTAVNAGTLVFSGPGAVSFDSALSIAPGATVLLQNGAMFNSYVGGGSLVVAPGSPVTLGANNSTGSASIVFSGSSTLTKVGLGSMTLTGTSSYTGKTSIQSGALLVASLNKVSGGTASSALGAPATAANGTIDLGSLTATGSLLVTGTAQTTDRTINLAGTTGGGVLDQSGTGALVFSGSVTATGAGSKTLTLQGSTSGTGEISGVIANNSSTNTTAVAKRGTGTWTLSGANTYSGGTTVYEGTLLIANANALGTGPLTIFPGAVINAVGISSRVVALDFKDNVSLETLDSTTPKGPLGTKIWNATAAQASGSKTGLSDDTGATSTVNVAWSSTNTWRVNGTATTSQDARILLGYLDDSPNTVTITNIPYATYNLYGIVASDNDLVPYNTQDFKVNNTWVFGGAAAALAPAFGSWEAAGSKWIQIDVPSARRGNYWKVSNLSGTTVTINGNTGQGGRGSLAAILVEGTNIAVPLTLASNAHVWNGDFAYQGPVPLDLTAGSVSMNADTAVTVASGTLAVANISGAYALGKKGAGTMVLSGTSTFTGPLNLTGGTLVLNGANALPAGVTINAAAGTTVLLQSGASTPNMIGGGVVVYAPGANAVLGAGDLTGSTDVLLSGSSNLTKLGQGSIVLTGISSYTGKTWIQSGVLSVASLNKVFGGTAFSSLGAPTTAANGTIDLGSLTATGSLVVTGSAQTTDRIINLAGTTGGGILDQSGTGLLAFTGSVTATGAGSKTLTLQGSTAGRGQLAGVIGDHSATHTTALWKQGTGTWILSGTNTYSGGTTLAEGTLAIANSAALGAGSLTFSGGFLDNVSGAALTLSRTLNQHWTGDFGFLGSSALNLGAGSISLTGDRTVQISASVLEVGGSITGGGSLRKTGFGTLVLGGFSDLSAFTLAEGSLLLKAGNAAGVGAVATGSATTVVLDAKSSNPPGLIHRWSFNELAGSILADSVGTAHGAIVTPSGASNASFNSGGVKLQGGAWGSASYVSMPANLLSGLTDFTVEVWASIDEVQPWSRIFEFGDGVTTSTSFLTAFTNGTDTSNPIICDTSKSGNVTPTAPVQTTLGRMYHYAVVWDSANAVVRWYRDGALLAQFSEDGRTLSQIPSGVFWLGRSHYIADLTSAATYSELRMWNKALDVAAIAASADAGPDAVLGVQNYTMASGLSGGAALHKNNGHTVTLSGVNSYSGGTVINAGSLRVSSGENLGSGAVSVAGGATLVVATDSDVDIANPLAGAGALLKTGSGTATFSGVGTNTGSLFVRAGTLRFDAGGKPGTGQIVVSQGATLAFSLTAPLTLPNAISGNVVNLNPEFRLKWANGATGGPKSTITSPLAVSAGAWGAFSYQISGTEEPTAFTASGLPSGLSLNSQSGVISGSLGSAGTHTVTLGVVNAGGTATAPLVLSVNDVPRTLALHFADGALDTLDTTTPKGPLGTRVWNVTNAGVATGAKTALQDDTGFASPVSVNWSAASTGRTGAATTTQNGRVLYGYLNDGSGASVTVANIPYPSYNVYGLVASDSGSTPCNTLDFRVNGTWVFGGTSAAEAPAFGSWEAAGQQWIQIDAERGRRGNFWKLTGLTGGTLTIQGQPGAAPNRGSLAAIIIEANPVPSILAEPFTQYVAPQTDATLAVGATGPGTLAYQWFKDGTAIAGGTLSTLNIPSVASAASYRVEVSSEFGMTPSRTVRVAPTLSAEEAAPLWTAGNNNYGQLGNGSTSDRTSPSYVARSPIPVVAGYSFSSGGTDFSGNGSTLSAFNGVTYSYVAVPSGQQTWAARLDGGSGGYLERTVLSSAPNSRLTIAAWIKTSSTDAVIAALNRTESSVNNSFQLYIDEAGNLAFSDWGTGAGFNAVSTGAVADGDWHHVAFVKNGLNGSFFVDGQPAGTASAAADVSYGVARFVLGKNARDNNGFFTGLLDDVRLYDTDLGASDIELLFAQAAAPVPSGVSSVLQVSAGASHTLLLTEGNNLFAVGANQNGALGDGTTTNRTRAVFVASNVLQAAASGSNFAGGQGSSYFIKTDGSLWGVGANDVGQLGDGSTAQRLRPGWIADNVVAVEASKVSSAFQPFVLFLKADGTLWGIGSNSYGQLGDGTTTAKKVPVLISSGVASFSAGGYHSAFVKTDGSLWVTGYNGDGQFGNGNFTNVTVPIQVATGVAQVSAGWQHMAFVKTDGTVWASGSNTFSQLGDGSTTARSTFAQVAASPGVLFSNATAVSCSNASTLVRRSDGAIFAFGYNGSGTLGDGTTTNRAYPVLVADGRHMSVGWNYSAYLGQPASLTNIQTNLVSVFALPGQNPVLSVVATGYKIAYQWYLNGLALIGSTAPQLQIDPQQNAGNYRVQLTSPFDSVSSDTARVAVRDTVGQQLFLSGLNTNGQLGDGTTANRSTPGLLVRYPDPALLAAYRFNGDGKDASGYAQHLSLGSAGLKADYYNWINFGSPPAESDRCEC